MPKKTSSNPNIDLWVKNIPNRYRALYKKALSGKSTPSGVYKAKCYECCGFEDVTRRVNECESYGCPVWAYRPVTK